MAIVFNLLRSISHYIDYSKDDSGDECEFRLGSSPVEGRGRRRVQGALRRLGVCGVVGLGLDSVDLGQTELLLLAACANLVPRIPVTHKWYMEKSGKDYPKTRKAIILILYWIFFRTF
ncbi:LOW QUALITY PROTEIN: 3-oxo-5-alpha-steroid 4-dehydrogenase, C-terminal [Parasponia andersonii]|uniref:3-oxo-5-alpha-steroid 4-dehydrogenase, C-terminal n=1 Tax=Parasponia andersonii TaxID=3476 RepID=A0A2P5AK61_PARAD|nr:LOW QUALITY PROTEIN: 3-oxo-5-alpha-steroid 4-dehydrogenase, C-terminal [Parasponia andersonii]